MHNIIKYTEEQGLIKAETTSEWFFIVLACMLWASGLVSFVLIAADKILGTGMFIRTVVRAFLYIFFAIRSLWYFHNKLRPIDWIFIFLFLLLYFLAPGSRYVSSYAYKVYTDKFLWALPFYLIGISLDFSKCKNLFHYLAIFDIIFSAYYNLSYIHAADYSGTAAFGNDNMSASYGFVLPVMYMIWYTFENFRKKTFLSWLDLASIIVGAFAMSMLGTRGPLICVFLFLILYLFFFKITKHKILYGLIFFVIGYVLVGFSNDIFSFLGNLAADLGFSDRIFNSFLSGDNLLKEGSSGRDAFFPILFKALADSPIWGYGLFGSFEFIGGYCHNVFMEILFSFGYMIGGTILLFGAYSLIKAFQNNLTKDENGFLFVLMGAGVLGLLFSSMFILNSSFFFYVGFCIQMAYRKS